jgi:DICT domain-containing protein
VFIVIDALDECASSDGTRKNLLSMIFRLQREADVKLLATSRFICDIEEKFEGLPTLEVKASDADLHTYLKGQMSLLPRCVSKSQELQNTITSKITEAAKGMSVSHCSKL